MSKKLDRRSFLKGATATAAASSLGFPALVNAGGHGGTTLKVQAAWGGGIFLENAQAYVDRVHAMAGKDLKIDLLSEIRQNPRILSDYGSCLLAMCVCINQSRHDQTSFQ